MNLYYTLLLSAASVQGVTLGLAYTNGNVDGVKTDVDIQKVEGLFFFGVSFGDNVAGVRNVDGKQLAVAGPKKDCLEGTSVSGSCQLQEFGAQKFSIHVEKDSDKSPVHFTADGQIVGLELPSVDLSKPVVRQTNLDVTCSNKGKANSVLNLKFVVGNSEFGAYQFQESGTFDDDNECENIALSFDFGTNSVAKFFADYTLARPRVVIGPAAIVDASSTRYFDGPFTTADLNERGIGRMGPAAIAGAHTTRYFDGQSTTLVLKEREVEERGIGAMGPAVMVDPYTTRYAHVPSTTTAVDLKAREVRKRATAILGPAVIVDPSTTRYAGVPTTTAETQEQETSIPNGIDALETTPSNLEIQIPGITAEATVTAPPEFVYEPSKVVSEADGHRTTLLTLNKYSNDGSPYFTYLEHNQFLYTKLFPGAN